MDNLSDKTVMVVDNGLFTAFARMLGRTFKKVYYWVPWAKAFVRSRELSVGVGFPEIERVRSPFRHGREDLTEKVDLWVFLDQFHNDLQWLAEHKFGARVWGARDAEELELYRWEARKVFQRLGLPVLEAEHLIGIDALEEHLRKMNEVRWIKNSFNVGGRADMETWKAENYELSRRRIDQLKYDIGGLAEVYEFISEKEYPKAEEIGYDGPTVDGNWPDKAMQAFEVKGLGMFGILKPYERLAEPVKIVNAAISPVLKQYGYRGMISTEIRWGKERKPYLIDPCCRLGSPSNELLQELIGNWAEIIWHGAAGELVPVKQVAKYAVCAMVYAELSGTNWEALQYPKAIDRWVKLRNPAIVRGTTYCVPQGQPQNLAGVVGVGNTMLEAISTMAERAKQVKGDRIDIALSSIGDALDVIARGEKYGIQFTEDRLPTVQELKKVVE